MIRSEAAKAVVNELFDTNRFEDLFTVANEVNKKLKEQREMINTFMKVLNIESIKILIAKEKMSLFLDALLPFLTNDDYFTKQEKKTFLNGCENVLFLNALANRKYDYAEILNQFRTDKNLYTNREFLINKIKEKHFDIVERLLDYSENVTYEFSKVIKLIYASGCRNYDFIKSIISKYNFNINAIGDMGLQYKAEGSFAHLVFLTTGDGADTFFNNFVRDFGQNINFNQKFNVLNSDKEFDLLDVVLSNSELSLKEKCSRITMILNYGLLSDKNINKLANVLMGEEFISHFYDHYVFDSLFSNSVFNSKNCDREKLISNILALDNGQKFKMIRQKTGNNPTSILLDKFFRLSSPLTDKTRNPLYLWLKSNGENKNYNINTFDTLVKYYRNDINNLNLLSLRIQSELMMQLINNGLVVEENKFLSSFFKKEKSNLYMNNRETNIDKKFEVEMLTMFDKRLVSKIQDPEVLSYIKEISENIDRLNILLNRETKDYEYVNYSLPKLVNKTLENFLNINEVNIKKNTLIQLNVFNNKTFEMLSDALNGGKNNVYLDTANKVIMGSIEKSVKSKENNDLSQKNEDRIIKIIK